MARFVTESHMRHHPLASESDREQNHVKYLKKFIFLIDKYLSF